MKGCLVALLATIGVILILPGMCYLTLGGLLGGTESGAVFLGIAAALIIGAIVLHLVMKGD
jgi:hypothetical protein